MVEPGPVGEVAVDPRREVAQHLDQRAPGGEARRGVVPYLVRDLRRRQIEGELRRERTVGPDGSGNLPRRQRRTCAVQLGARRFDLDDRLAGDGEPAVPLGDMEIRAHVSVGVPAGGTVCRLGVDRQRVGETALPGGVARREEAAAVGTGHHVGVPVNRIVSHLISARTHASAPARSGPRFAAILTRARLRVLTASPGVHRAPTTAACRPAGTDASR